MFNKGQLAGLMKQAQAMQDNLKKAQDELALMEVEGESGAGLVKVLMTAKHDVKCFIFFSMMRPPARSTLDAYATLVRTHAVRKAEELSAEKMGKLMPAGMPGMPPGTTFAFYTRYIPLRR